MNSICWAPHEIGLWLASGSSDGTIRILKHKADSSWDVQIINDAHAGGVNCVSWAPAIPSSSLINSNSASNNNPNSTTNPPLKRIVSGGCDNVVKVWVYVYFILFFCAFSNFCFEMCDWIKRSFTKIRISCGENENNWKEESKLDQHSDWVRDVAWAPNIGIPSDVIASCSQVYLI